jgi:hypothetical protein
VEDERFFFVCGEFSNLNPGQMYRFQLRAVNDSGEGPWSESSFSASTVATVPCPPEPPHIVKAALTSILFGWSKCRFCCIMSI